MVTFQRKTLRQMTPLQREIAEAINECDATKRRLRRVMDHVFNVELDAQALRSKFPDLAWDSYKAHKLRGRKDHNKGRQTLAQLDEAFHDPIPLERQLLGE